MAPGGIMMMIVSPLGGKLTDARGPKFTLISGVLVIALGYGLSLVLMGSAWGLMLTCMVINSGVGLAYGSMPALIMSSVPLSETAAANGFNTLMRSLGTSVGSAVIGVVLAQMTTSVAGYTFTSESGFRTGLIVGGCVALVAAAVAAVIPAARAAGDDKSGPTATPETAAATR
jgi:MFS family permease